MATPSLDLSHHEHGVWNLNEFVEVANALLPGYLPKDATGRKVEEVNARLVRHYATQGLLPEARKEGREARYLYDHLLQLLVVRKLLADGFSAAAARQVLAGRSADDLHRLLHGSARIELVAEPAHANVAERTEFLRRVRARAGLEPLPPAGHAPAPMSAPDAPVGDAPFSESRWTRLGILDGLDLFVRDDFVLPTNRLGDDQLTQLLKVVLLQLEQRRKNTP